MCKRAIAAWANQLELNERWRHAFRYGDNCFLMANIEISYGEYRTSYGEYRIPHGDNLASYGEYPFAIWRKLFCYGENCLGGREGELSSKSDVT